MVDKIISPISPNELITKVNDIIDAIPTDNAQLGNGAGYITGISSSDVTEALGYTPYDAANPDGYITGVTSSMITSALEFTPANNSNVIHTTGNETKSGTMTFNGKVTTAGDLLVGNSNTQHEGGQIDLAKCSNSSLKSNISIDQYDDSLRFFCSNSSGQMSMPLQIEFNVGYALGITPESADNSTKLATTAFVKNQGYITDISSSDITAALGYTPYNGSTNPNGYITGISSSDITTALGYTPYDSSNPEGYISSVALSSLTDVTISSPSAGENLTYDAISGKWKNTSTTASVAWGGITGTLSDQSDLSIALGGKQATITGAATTITGFNLTANRALVSNGSGKVAVSTTTSTELGYLSGVTSAIQTQIDAKTTMADVEAKGYLTEITSSEVTTALGFTPYDSSNPAGYITGITSSDVTTALGFTPESTSQKVTSITSTSTDTQYPSAKAVYTATNANATAISTINGKIPSDASSSNQLADKAFVNSSISTNTAYFIGTFQSLEALNAYSGTKTNNDYAFVKTTDTEGNTLYDRYKWNGTEWLFEYELNNSSFTADQWATINSGCTSTTASLAESALQADDVTSSYSATGTAPVNGTAVKEALDGLTIPTTTSSVTSGSTAALTSGGAYTNLVRRLSTTTATGGINQGVYIDANGQVQACDATTSTYSANGTTAVNGIAVASAISGKQNTITGAATSITGSNLTANRALVSNGSGKVAVSTTTSTELGYLSGVTSAIQTQLDGKTTMADVEAKGYITGINSSDVTAALGYTPYDAANPNGYITGITSSMVTTALGFTPYNSTNPSGYQANVIEGVQINGTDLAISSKKVNIPVAGTDTLGVGMANMAYGVSNYNNYLAISKATDTLITAKTDNYRPLVPSNIDLAVKTGITTNTNTLTSAEKAAACSWLGALSEDTGIPKALLQKYRQISSGNVTLGDDYVVYYQPVTTATAFTFDTSAVTWESYSFLTFELAVYMSSVQALSFSNVTWLNGEAPDISESGFYLFAFRTIDMGASWIGNIQGVWPINVEAEPNRYAWTNATLGTVYTSSATPSAGATVYDADNKVLSYTVVSYDSTNSTIEVQ